MRKIAWRKSHAKSPRVLGASELDGVAIWRYEASEVYVIESEVASLAAGEVRYGLNVASGYKTHKIWIRYWMEILYTKQSNPRQGCASWHSMALRHKMMRSRLSGTARLVCPRWGFSALRSEFRRGELGYIRQVPFSLLLVPASWKGCLERNCQSLPILESQCT